VELLGLFGVEAKRAYSSPRWLDCEEGYIVRAATLLALVEQGSDRRLQAADPAKARRGCPSADRVLRPGSSGGANGRFPRPAQPHRANNTTTNR